MKTLSDNEAFVAPAKRWAELHLEVAAYVDKKPLYMASTEQIEFVLKKFAQAHVQKALKEASVYGCLREDTFGPEDILNCYPLEDIK